MSESLDTRRRRLIYRAAHRGMKEMDLVLGPFVARRVATMSHAELDDLEVVLGCPDPELWAWLMGDGPMPVDAPADLMAELRASCANGVTPGATT